MKFIWWFFFALGVVFFFILSAGVYFYITDPLELKPLISGSKPEIIRTTNPEVSNSSSDSGAINQIDTSTNTSMQAVSDDIVTSSPTPLLSPTQIEVLGNFGIDPSTIPSTISPTQEACFVEKLGADRVAEIKAGAVPNALEFLLARPCLE